MKYPKLSKGHNLFEKILYYIYIYNINLYP